ncbi:hypothetical protein SAMN04488508_105361 [Aquimarina spongiae]|uniref:Uncharacterized protein n=1 Tax=Aquimarina spongiae TaxID=570521 RepID=A0A1M6GNA4_9FLAO|nr:hypothetical protein SAMN04488508_105361 [Aquimarina spongiae]
MSKEHLAAHHIFVLSIKKHVLMFDFNKKLILKNCYELFEYE